MEYKMGRTMYCIFKNQFGQINIIKIIFTLIFIMAFYGQAGATDYTLTWDANSEPDLAGYRVYYKANSSGQPSGDYDVKIDVGNVTSKTIKDLDSSVKYFFAVTAYDDSGLESDFSNEVSSTGTAVITSPDTGNTLNIVNKPPSIPYVSAGDSSAQFTVQGGDGSYTWTVEKNGEPVDESSGSSYTFHAPDAGAFAGRYKITATDGKNFTDSFYVDVPLKISPSQYVMQANSNPLTITVSGADSNTVFDVAQYDLQDNNVLGEKGYGTVEPAGNGSFIFTPDDVDQVVSFTFAFTAESSDSSLAGDSEITSDHYRVIPTGVISGRIVDNNGIGIANADVTLLSPKQFVNSIVTAEDGFFLLSDIPVSVGRYRFRASKKGYVSAGFSSDDLQSGDTQNNIVLENADTYIEGTVNVSLYPADLSDGAFEITLSYLDSGKGVLVDKVLSSDGKFRMDFEEAPGISEYILTASLPGQIIRDGSGQIIDELPRVSGQMAIENLPQSEVSIDIDKEDFAGDNVDALAGGASRLVTIAGQPVSIVNVPFGGFDPSEIPEIEADITTYDNSSSARTMGSGDLLYDIDLNPAVPVILTLPFSLAEVAPGDFENGNAVIYHGETTEDLTSGTSFKKVDISDIISIDYTGDGSTGLIEFYTDSFSVFGIGTNITSGTVDSGSSDSSSSTSTGNTSANNSSAENSAGKGGDGGACFIATAAYGSYFEPHVEILRKFRDVYLIPTPLGNAFVRAYYRYSPPLADYIRKHDSLRAVVRIGLAPLIAFAYLAIHTGVTLKIAAISGFLVLICFWGLLIRIKKGAGT